MSRLTYRIIKTQSVAGNNLTLCKQAFLFFVCLFYEMTLFAGAEILLAAGRYLGFQWDTLPPFQKGILLLGWGGSNDSCDKKVGLHP